MASWRAKIKQTNTFHLVCLIVFKLRVCSVAGWVYSNLQLFGAATTNLAAEKGADGIAAVVDANWRGL